MMRDEKMVVEDETLCTIEIFREGDKFAAIVEAQPWKRGYRNAVFEDLLREIVLDLQEDLGVD